MDVCSWGVKIAKKPASYLNRITDIVLLRKQRKGASYVRGSGYDMSYMSDIAKIMAKNNLQSGNEPSTSNHLTDSNSIKHRIKLHTALQCIGVRLRRYVSRHVLTLFDLRFYSFGLQEKSIQKRKYWAPSMDLNWRRVRKRECQFKPMACRFHPTSVPLRQWLAVLWVANYSLQVIITPFTFKTYSI